MGDTWVAWILDRQKGHLGQQRRQKMLQVVLLDTSLDEALREARRKE